MKEFTWAEGVAGWKFKLQVAKWVAKGCMSWSHQGGDCKGNCPTRPTIGCSTTSGYHGGVWFARFSREKKH